MNTKELQELFDNVLSPAGFRRRRDTWYKTNDDTIALVNLQKSQWGGQYYVNVALYIRDLGKAVSPAEYQSHIRTRLASIAGSEASAIEEALDLERTALAAEERRSVLARALSAIAVPFLSERSTLSRLRDLNARGELGPVLLTKGTRELLERDTS